MNLFTTWAILVGLWSRLRFFKGRGTGDEVIVKEPQPPVLFALFEL